MHHAVQYVLKTGQALLSMNSNLVCFGSRETWYRTMTIHCVNGLFGAHQSHAETEVKYIPFLTSYHVTLLNGRIIRDISMFSDLLSAEKTNLVMILRQKDMR